MNAQTADSPNELSRGVIEQLFADAPAVERGDEGERIALFCQSSEGDFCYYLSLEQANRFTFAYDPELESAANQFDRERARAVINELGPKVVECTRNNTVLVRCHRSAEGTLSCEINGSGEGWDTLEIR